MDGDPLRRVGQQLHQADRARARAGVRVELALLVDHCRRAAPGRAGSCARGRARSRRSGAGSGAGRTRPARSSGRRRSRLRARRRRAASASSFFTRPAPSSLITSPHERVELLERAVVDVGEVGLRNLDRVGQQARLALVGRHARRGRRAPAGGAVTTTTDVEAILARRPRRAAAPRSRSPAEDPAARRAARASPGTRSTTSGCSSASSQSSASRSAKTISAIVAAVDLARLVEDPVAEALAQRLAHSLVVAQQAVDDLVAGDRRPRRGARTRRVPRSCRLRCRR